MRQDGLLFYNPPAMTYREHAPAPRLAPIVDRIWTLEGSRGEFGETDQPVLPDGRPELILHFGDRFRLSDLFVYCIHWLIRVNG